MSIDDCRSPSVWQSRTAIEAFAGQDIDAAVVPAAAQEMLAEFDRRVRHFEIVDTVTGTGSDSTSRHLDSMTLETRILASSDQSILANVAPDVFDDALDPRLVMNTSKNLVSIRPFFIVKDLQASIAYYRDRLGFQVDFQGPADDVYYAGLSRDDVGVMLKVILPDVLPQPNHTRHEWARWDAYIYTLDPDALFAEFSQRGVSFVKPLSFIDEGLWGFEINDADGYVIAFFQLRDK